MGADGDKEQVTLRAVKRGGDAAKLICYPATTKPTKHLAV